MPIVFTPKHYRLTRQYRRLFAFLAIIFWFAASILLIIPILPNIYYRLSPKTPQVLAQTIGQTIKEKPVADSRPVPPLPEFDSTLPTDNRLIIKKIGVDGVINEGNWEEALPKGIWHEPQFGAPSDPAPVVLASHRWGYLNWTNTFRRQNSFYSLPSLEEGDEIGLIWQQRLYLYTVYQTKTSETIEDYSADLILYTCQLWDSPIRAFVYARRKL